MRKSIKTSKEPLRRVHGSTPTRERYCAPPPLRNYPTRAPRVEAAPFPTANPHRGRHMQWTSRQGSPKRRTALSGARRSGARIAPRRRKRSGRSPRPCRLRACTPRRGHEIRYTYTIYDDKLYTTEGTHRGREGGHGYKKIRTCTVGTTGQRIAGARA